MSKKVLEKIAKNYKNLQQGVDEIMGGHVLEHEGKTILNQGIAIGKQQGILIGEQRGKFEIAKRLREMGLNDDDIQQATLLPIEEIKLLYK